MRYASAGFYKKLSDLLKFLENNMDMLKETNDWLTDVLRRIVNISVI